MSVEVAVEDNVGLLHEPPDEALDVEDGREGLLDDGLVLTVEVTSGQGAPGVAHHHTVRVQHGHHLEEEQVGEIFQRARVARLSTVEEHRHHLNFSF